ncbi:TRAP transporter small permease [Pseudodonghicola flavimaris]|uniref:TRAP transporter small permease protein n=1 Tax=Pseudodonghicola flavimaris TaxID=3050036 RepID=A0ABT7F3L5_9RHOB|nr:TRAP transporter small permease [Pseudodonghicola flavimaris]MDK3019202.1 TRAP transporter small permease [Pseudodonghicola flavimaris]
MEYSFPQRVLRAISATILGVLVVAVFVNIVLRFLFNSGLVVTEELSRLLLVWLVFVAAIAVSLSGRHLGMSLIVEKLPRRAQFALAVLGAALMLLCDALLGIGAWSQVQFGLRDYLPVSGLPVAVVYAAGLLGALAFALATLWRIARLLSGRMTPAEWFRFDAKPAESE